MTCLAGEIFLQLQPRVMTDENLLITKKSPFIRLQRAIAEGGRLTEISGARGQK